MHLLNYFHIRSLSAKICINIFLEYVSMYMLSVSPCFAEPILHISIGGAWPILLNDDFSRTCMCV